MLLYSKVWLSLDIHDNRLSTSGFLLLLLNFHRPLGAGRPLAARCGGTHATVCIQYVCFYMCINNMCINMPFGVHYSSYLLCELIIWSEWGGRSQRSESVFLDTRFIQRKRCQQQHDKNCTNFTIQRKMYRTTCG